MTTISLQTIHDDSLWVAKMPGYRRVGTHAEVGHLFYDFDCRDFDTVCADGQPEHVRPFWEAYEAYGEEYGFCFVDDFYRNVYAAEALKADPSLGEYVERPLEGDVDSIKAESAEKQELYSQCCEAEKELREVLGMPAYDLAVFDRFNDFSDATVGTMYGTLDVDTVCAVMRKYGFYFLKATNDGDELHFVRVA